MHRNLHLQRLSNFSAPAEYWSSAEIDLDSAKAFRVGLNTEWSVAKGGAFNVRAARAF
jgi:hypothetical protein